MNPKERGCFVFEMQPMKSKLETLKEELDKVSNDLEVAEKMDIREDLKFQLVLELTDKKYQLIKALHKAIDEIYTKG